MIASDVKAGFMETSHKNVRFQVLSGVAEDSSLMECVAGRVVAIVSDIYSVFHLQGQAVKEEVT